MTARARVPTIRTSSAIFGGEDDHPAWGTADRRRVAGVTTAIELPGLDLPALERYLAAAAPQLFDSPLRASVLAGGRSNLTYEITDGATRRVLRRPPLGHVLATAHDMRREYRAISALWPAGFPVPEPVLHCADPGVIGAPFYLMQFVEGTTFRNPDALASLAPATVRALILSLVDTLADLHMVVPAVVGLRDFGRPEGFNARQVWRWRQQLDASRSRELAGIDELHARLAATAPPCPVGTIVHGDYRVDNVLVDPDGRVQAVLDWEMSTLGDPLGDLALMLVYAMAVTADGKTAMSVPGHPDRDDIVHRYASRGREAANLGWYEAFAAFKLAVILEGVHYRFRRGLTVGAGFDRVGERVGPLVALGHQNLRRL